MGTDKHSVIIEYDYQFSNMVTITIQCRDPGLSLGLSGQSVADVCELAWDGYRRNVMIQGAWSLHQRSLHIKHLHMLVDINSPKSYIQSQNHRVLECCSNPSKRLLVLEQPKPKGEQRLPYIKLEVLISKMWNSVMQFSKIVANWEINLLCPSQNTHFQKLRPCISICGIGSISLFEHRVWFSIFLQRKLPDYDFVLIQNFFLGRLNLCCMNVIEHPLYVWKWNSDEYCGVCRNCMTTALKFHLYI